MTMMCHYVKFLLIWEKALIQLLYVIIIWSYMIISEIIAKLNISRYLLALLKKTLSNSCDILFRKNSWKT